ncbi:MAG: monooxygenase [Anaerolineae bacterium]|jgi:hypothetical protein
MITEVVTFKIPPGTTREEHFENSAQTALGWGENPDLVRKYYLLDLENGIAGGVYLWHNKADSEKWHGAEWKAIIKEFYGSEPESRYFETTVVVDNVVGEIIKDGA